MSWNFVLLEETHGNKKPFKNFVFDCHNCEQGICLDISQVFQIGKHLKNQMQEVIVRRTGITVAKKEEG